MKSYLRASAALRAVAVLGAGLSTVMLAAPAMAQDYTRGGVSGTVTNAANAPLAGATVTITSNEQGFTRSTTSDANGRFEIQNLPTGAYTLNIRGAGGEVVNDPTLTVIAGQTAGYSYTAEASGSPAGASTNTADSGEAGAVITGRRVRTNDLGSTTTGLSIDVARLVENVPVPRTQSGLILLAPGTNQGDSGFADCSDCVSFGGATIAENSYYVNGLNTTNFRTLVGNSTVPFEFYRTFDVRTGGWTAEYGRALGGVTSAVTKSGTNTFEYGSVITWSPDKLQSDGPNTFANRDGQIRNLNERDYRENIQANFYASGPVIKDRLFFYGLFTPRYSKNEDTSVTGGFRFRTTSSTPFYGLKLDAIPIDGHRLEGTFWSDDRTLYTDYLNVSGNDGTLTGISTGREKNRLGGKNYIAQYTGQLTDWFTLSGLYGVNNYRRESVVAGVAVPIVQSNLGAGVGSPSFGTISTTTASGVPIAPTSGKDKRTVYRVDANIIANFLGRHNFRVGWDREDLESGENTFYTGDRIYRFTANYIRARTYINQGAFESKQTAYYIQDSWDLFDERLNLNLGLRNDNYANYGVTGAKFIEQKNQWAPRLGASFDVLGDKRTKLNVFWGRYYLGVPTNTNIRLGGAEIFYEQRFGYLPGVDRTQTIGNGIPVGQLFGPDGAPLLGALTAQNAGTCPNFGPGAGQLCTTTFSDGVAGPTDTLVAEGLDPMYQDEFILGGTHRMGDWTFGLRYINRRLGTTLEDVAIDAAVLAYCDENGIEGCADVFTGFHQYVLANPGQDITVRLDGDCSIAGQCDVVTLSAADLGYPKPTRKYDAVEFQLSKAFNGTYGFDFSYTWQKVRGNYEGSVKSDNNQDDAGLTQDFDQPGLVDGANGILANERKHTFKLFGSWKPVENITIGGNLTVQSPRNFSCIGVHPTDPFAPAYGAASFYCGNPLATGLPLTEDRDGDGVNEATESVIIPRGSAFKGKWLRNLDLGVQFQLPAYLGRSSFRVDVFNVLNWASKTDYIEFGENDDGSIRPDYRLVSGYQAPRSVRLTWALRFGGAQR